MDENGRIRAEMCFKLLALLAHRCVSHQALHTFVFQDIASSRVMHAGALKEGGGQANEVRKEKDGEQEMHGRKRVNVVS